MHELAFARFKTNTPTWLLALAVAGFACGRVGYDEIEDIADMSRLDASLRPESTTSGAGGSADAATRDAVDTEVEPDTGLAPDAEDATDAGGEIGGEGGSDDAGSPDAPPPCPSTLSFSASIQMPIRGGQFNSSPANDDCPTGQVVIGYKLGLAVRDGLVGQMSTMCGTLSINTNCELAVSAGATLPVRGMVSDIQYVRQCPANQVVVGSRMRSGDLIDQLSVGCAMLTLTPVGSTYQVSIGAVTWLMPVGGMGGVPVEDVCPSGLVATGNLDWSDMWVNVFALHCSMPLLAR